MDSIAHKRQRPDSDDDIDASTLFRAQVNFPKFIIIESTNKETQVTSLSPFVIEKQIESMGHESHVGQAKFCLRVCQVVFPRVLRFSPHLPIDSSRYE